MSQVINTNIASLNAQRNLSNSQDDLNTSLERLSSGLRINSAKDDAAGLAIAERFTSQIRGMDQATRNANDGISFAQTAEGALGEIGNALQRVRELAVQSANDTNSATDRQALNNEVQELVDEVNRISDSAQFNGQNILDGTLEDLVFQVGANANQTISVDGVDARGKELGARVAEGAGIVNEEYSALTDISLNGVTVDLGEVESVNDVISEINNASSDSEVTARQASETEAAFTGITGNTAGTDDSITINGVEIALTQSDDAEVMAEDINNASSQTGVTAEGDGSGNLTLTSGSSDIDVDDGSDFLNTGVTTETINIDAGIVLEGPVGEDITVGGSNDTNLNLDTFVSNEDQTVNNTSVATREDATTAINTMDSALQQVNGLRAELGAVQTRFESTIANLEIGSENLSAARSRIQDADFAAETANLTKGQILQQAGTSVLSQANQLPQNTLSLLQ